MEKFFWLISSITYWDSNYYLPNSLVFDQFSPSAELFHKLLPNDVNIVGNNFWITRLKHHSIPEFRIKIIFRSSKLLHWCPVAFQFIGWPREQKFHSTILFAYVKVILVKNVVPKKIVGAQGCRVNMQESTFRHFSDDFEHFGVINLFLDFEKIFRWPKLFRVVESCKCLVLSIDLTQCSK